MENKINPFIGRNITVTGKFKGFTREGVNSLILKIGATVSKNVTKRTDCLIRGSKPGSKFAKVKKLGISILRENQFYDMITG